MTLSFPPSPSVGQGYQQFQWDGAKWVPNPGAVPGLVTSVNGQSGAVNLLGSRVLILRQDVSAAVASVNFISGIDSTYDEFELHWYGVQTTGGSFLFARTSNNNGASWDAGTSYSYATMFGNSSAPAASGGGANNASLMQISNSIDQTSSRISSGVMNFWPRPSGQSSSLLTRSHTTNNANGLLVAMASGLNTNATGMNGLQIGANTGTITAGTFILYGVKK
jgi:hypothetical protein